MPDALRVLTEEMSLASVTPTASTLNTILPFIRSHSEFDTLMKHIKVMLLPACDAAVIL